MASADGDDYHKSNDQSADNPGESKSIYCGVGCGCGGCQTVCDESCIRKIAAINCRSVCLPDVGGPVRPASKPGAIAVRPPVEDIVSANAAKPDDAPSSCKKSCCGTKEPAKVAPKGCGDGCCPSKAKTDSDTISKSRCGSNNQQKPKPPNECSSSVKKNNCCDSTGRQSSCCSKKDGPIAEQPKGCCVKKQEDTTTTCASKTQASTCCASKKAEEEKHDKLNESDSCCGELKPQISTSSSCTPKAPVPSTAAEACADHYQQAFAEYSRYLAKGLCICSSVLSRIDTCSGKPVNENQKPKDSPTSGRSTTLEAPQQLSRRSAAAKQCNKSCCGKERTQDEISTPKVNYETTQKTSSVREKEIDIEKSAARQNVTLKVVGMTCTGCSRKAFNVLNNINGISSVRVTFVTGVAEFDLDPAISSLEQVLPQIEKETGFKFSQVVSDYQTLELHFDPLTAKSVYEKIRSIVESVEKIDKTTYRISYDPSVIGARTLLSSIPGASLAPPGNDTALVDGRKRLLKMSWSTGIAAVLTIPILALNWSDNPVPYSARSVVSLVLATFVQALAVPEFYVGALKSLIYSKVLEMDMLIVISITAAYGYSVVAFSLTHAGYVLQTGEFFETSSLLITLVLLGKLVAAVAKMKAISAVSLRSLQAEKAMLVGPSGETVEIDCRLLEMGDSFVVPPHSRVVTDGVITSGSSSIDESMITGESTPVAKTIHDEIIAGTINGPSPLTVRMTRLPGKNSITDIAKLVENALASKPRVQDIADKVASYFIPVVISIALIVFLIWIAVALKVRKENGGSAVGIAITYAIAVLAVSCPCAVGLAVPMVLVIAGGAAARSGVIIKQADSLERAYSITDVVFDKTGTITKGDLVVVHEEILDQRFPSSDIISLVRSLTKDSQHPVSMAVAAYLQQSPYGPTCLENTESVPGSGIQCAWKGSVVKAGNPYWLNLEATAEILTLLEKGMTLFCVTVDSAVVVVFGLKSSIRDEAQQVIANLQRRKINCHIVSGDAPKVVEDIAAVVGIPLSNVASRHSPAEKQQYIESLMASGRKVLFCGDGTNDAVAVAQADIGMQIGTTSDVTRAVADVVLLGGLEGVEVLLNISKRSSQRIIFNFVWAAFYNLFAIVLAGGAFVKARIPPGYAGLGEIVSVVPVIVAAMTLSRTKRA